MAGEAKVYILDVPYHADIAYSYYIPDEIASQVCPGAVVEVPFGRGNRRMSGIVDEVNSGDVPMSTKPITSVISPYPLLDEEQIGLCRFVKEYTLCTFSEALKTIVPSAAMSRVITYYRVVPEKLGETYPSSMTERAKRVLDIARGKARFSNQTLQSELDFDVSGTVYQLERQGYIEKVTEIKGQSAVKKRLVYSLSENVYKEDIELALKRLRGVNQRRILEYIAENEPTTQSEVSRELDIKPSAVKTAAESLENNGYISIVEEDEFRNHYAFDENTLENVKSEKPVLSEEQKLASEKIIGICDEKKPAAILLHGVTGSGKTAVIMEAIDHVLACGRGVIMLVPEIALTPQTVGIFLGRYGSNIAVIHSGLSAGERFDAWRRIKDGLAKVVIGTRSAVFAPLSDIGLIVIDEEHEYTYKSDTNPKYKAHDIARKRCADHNAVMLLASATPSVSSYYKAETGVYTLVELKERYGKMPLPTVDIVDMRSEAAAGNISPVSAVLEKRLREDKQNGNQSILFLNRRGYNNYVSCRSCGKSLKCPNCSLTLTYHTKRNCKLSEVPGEEYEKSRRDGGYLVCHICGYRSSVPEKCPECGMDHFLFMGCGTQKAEDDIVSMFPDLRLLRMDHDTTQAKFSHEEILDKFRNGQADVLLGTQMVTKGHDFPLVATVGVLNADNALALDDYRAGERTFAMLTQVIGRAGRGDTPGKAVIQTFNPENDVILKAAKQDYASFYKSEIRLRRALCFPPFCDIAVITLSSVDEGYLALMTNLMSERIREHIRDDYSDIPMMLFGPFEAPLYRVQNTYRMRFVIKCKLNKRMREFISDLVCEFSRLSQSGHTKKIPSVKTNARLTVTSDLNPSTV